MIKLLFFLYAYLFAFSAFAQQSLNFAENLNDGYLKNAMDQQIDYLTNLYYQKSATSYDMINGRDYVPYYFQSKLKPILFFDKEYFASIVFNGREYNNIFLEYDTFKDEVIFTDTTRYLNNRFCKISLNKDLISNFRLNSGPDSLTFIYLKATEDSSFNLREGFYEMVYNGKSKFVIRHQSSVIETNGKPDYYYTPISYIRTGSDYIRIRSVRQLTKLLSDKAEGIKNFIHINKFKAGKAYKNQILQILKYYDTLSV